LWATKNGWIVQSKFDLIVIGSGPAGQKAAISMAKRNKSVLVIENRAHVGGGCLHTGTIPSKTMREAAIRFVGMQRKKKSALQPQKKEDITLSDIVTKLETVIGRELEIVDNQLTRNNVGLAYGTASFIDKNTVCVTDENGDCSKYAAENILIATGSSPNRPTTIPFDDEIICDSDSILQMQDIPKSIIIVGAGVIGSEYACIFSEMGVKVHLINKYQDILNFVDVDLRRRLMADMKASGITLYSEIELKSIERTAENKARAVLNNGVELEAGMLLYCQGRNGNTKKLELENVGIKVQKYQLLQVNSVYQTSVPNIYACGDVIGYPSLASVSSEQGRQAAYHMLDIKAHSYSDHFPYGIYTIPEISFVGKNEDELAKENIPFVTGVSDFKEIARGHIQGHAKGLLKLIIHEENFKLLGVHIIGYGAAELIHIGQAVMSFNGDLHYFLDSVFNYPTLAEAYKVAALNAYNQLPPTCSFHTK
jgi:NAD(P) transhydrogenase